MNKIKYILIPSLFLTSAICLFSFRGESEEAQLKHKLESYIDYIDQSQDRSDIAEGRRVVFIFAKYGCDSGKDWVANLQKNVPTDIYRCILSIDPTFSMSPDDKLWALNPIVDPDDKLNGFGVHSDTPLILFLEDGEAQQVYPLTCNTEDVIVDLVQKFHKGEAV